jgi:Zn-dependent metalloprotease
MNKFDGCYCFAIPHKMFRKLIAASPDSSARAHTHMNHAAKLRSARYGAVPAAGAPDTSREVRLSVFDVAGTENLPGALVRSGNGPRARDAAANEAFENAAIALKFYREVVGRNSVDGRGMPIDSAVHFGEGFPNAFWSGSQMIYGDGNEHVGGFTKALDLIAHELTHGVTQHLIPQGLGVVKVPPREREFEEQKYALKGQAGALNESLSDVFGCMVKQWHTGQTVDKADWLIGKGVVREPFGFAIRSLKSPGDRKLTWCEDAQIRSMDQYEEGCDAHDAAGIPSHAFYRAAMKMGGHSWEKAGPVWMNGYASLRADAGFRDAANATIAVAAAHFGKDSVEAGAVKAAWQEVKVL